MDFPLNSSLNSSLVLALAVALWLVWVGPFFLRRPTASAAPTTAATTIRPPVSPDKGSQGIIMNNIGTTPSGGGSLHVHGQPAARPAQPFRIRTDRTVLAAAGLAGVLTVVVGTLLAAFTSVSWFVPAVGVAILAGAVAALRALTVRERRRRVDHAFRAAMGPDFRDVEEPSVLQLPEETPAAETEDAEPQPETVLFDLESAPAPDEAVAAAGAVPARPTPGPPPTARKSAPAAAHVPLRPGTTPWQPVELPKPVYVDSPKAERPAPEPIILPETPRSVAKTPLRPSTAPASVQRPRPESGKINLDDVLQRRRA
ncbi:hypothetical protein [Arthrobacter yangruifuii]|uniref:hypothetical protein n=1 Tax=Arthrobacter yangruifuii TaxID=2606616 RepID=UPI0011B85BCF|nr:hypothetical protein [Arthrobacter yangruifuii]